MIVQPICQHVLAACAISGVIADIVNRADLPFISLAPTTPLSIFLAVMIFGLFLYLIRERMLWISRSPTTLFIVMLATTPVFYDPGNLYSGLTAQYMLALMLGRIYKDSFAELLPAAIITFPGVVLTFVVYGNITGQALPTSFRPFVIVIVALLLVEIVRYRPILIVLVIVLIALVGALAYIGIPAAKALVELVLDVIKQIWVILVG